MDKKILIALGLISAFSIDNATGMNGIIENPSVNESQSMKTINDFSDDLRSLGPVNRLFNCSNYWDMKNWKKALYEISEITEFYLKNESLDISLACGAFCHIFGAVHTVIDFINSSEYDDRSAKTIEGLFRIAYRFTNLFDDKKTQGYSIFICSINHNGLKNTLQFEVENDYRNIGSLAEAISYSFYGE